VAVPVVIFITDPDFEPKAQRVLDLYQRMGMGNRWAAETM